MVAVSLKQKRRFTRLPAGFGHSRRALASHRHRAASTYRPLLADRVVCCGDGGCDYGFRFSGDRDGTRRDCCYVKRWSDSIAAFLGYAPALRVELQSLMA